jgi:hypothetical protein
VVLAFPLPLALTLYFVAVVGGGDMMGWISHSNTYFQVHVSSYSYVLSCQAAKPATSRGAEWAMFIHYGKLLGSFERGPKSLSRVNERGGRGRQVVKSYLPTLNSRVEK